MDNPPKCVNCQHEMIYGYVCPYCGHMEESQSPVAKRRLKDVATAMKVSVKGTARDLKAQLELVHDGIAAVQSLDDLGPPLNRQLAENEKELWAKRKAIGVRLVRLLRLGERQVTVLKALLQSQRGAWDEGTHREQVPQQTRTLDGLAARGLVERSVRPNHGSERHPGFRQYWFSPVGKVVAENLPE